MYHQFATRQPGPRHLAPRQFTLRLAILQLLVLAMMLILLGRLWQVQLAGASAGEGGGVDRMLPLPVARGRILDVHGSVLGDNTDSLVVLADRSVLSRMTRPTHHAVFERLGRVLKADPETLRAKVLVCGSPEARPFPHCWNGSPYEPVPLASGVQSQVALAIAERSEEFPGITVEPRLIRQVRSSSPHLLGYVAPPNEKELRVPGIERSDLVGRAGLEQVYDDDLRGVHGKQTMRLDAAGRVTRIVSETPSLAGNDLVTSIDARIQRVAETELHNAIELARTRGLKGDSGAAVVLEAKTGRVVALASEPTYDPNIWRNGLNSRERGALFGDGAPMLSRVIQGEFAPASTFKVVPTAAALELGMDPDAVLPCPATMRIGGRIFRNYRSHAYGPVDFGRALAVSCDTFFYRLGIDFWREPATHSAIRTMARAFGLGVPTGVDLPGEAAGNLGTRLPHAGDAALFAIGQGDTTVTPLQVAVAYAAIANGGTVWSPRIGKLVTDRNGSVVRKINPNKRGDLPLTKEQLDALRAGLRRTTTEGTAAGVFRGFDLGKRAIGAKTGTGEVAGKQTTSWLATFDDKYSVVMMVAQGGTGAGTSGPSVRRIWEALPL